MNPEEKQLIRNEIDKYFKTIRFTDSWLSHTLKPIIELPDDGFELRNLSSINIDQDSINQIAPDCFNFGGSAKALYIDPASNIKGEVNVEIGGHAFIETKWDRTQVREVELTHLHRTAEIIPKA